MILILSEESDVSTDHVVSWLRHFNAPFIRYNNRCDNFIEAIQLCDEGLAIKTKEETVPFENIGAVWFRRGFLTYRSDFYDRSIQTKAVQEQITEHLANEVKVISEFTYAILSKKYCINMPEAYEVNKLQTLFEAQAVGLRIPATLISNKPHHLKEFQNNYPALITKSLSNNVQIDEEERTYSLGTKRLRETPKYFFYSMFPGRDKSAESRCPG